MLSKVDDFLMTAPIIFMCVWLDWCHQGEYRRRQPVVRRTSICGMSICQSIN